MNARLLIAAACSLASCSADPGLVKQYRFDKDVVIVTKISGSGGALGNETYEAFYRHNGEETKFFQGVNPKAFSIGKAENAVYVRFCDGSVSLAQPIFIEPPNERLIHLDLDMACPT